MASRYRWDDLQAFLAVARAGRLTVAARMMAVEHTTLSRRLKRLEDSLGTKLFERRPTGYVLTPDGEALIPRAEGIERATLRIWSDRFDRRTSLSGSIRVGTPEAFGTFCLAERLADFADIHPDLVVELVAMPRAFSLSKREADLAIALSRPETGRLHARKLTDYELGLYASPAYCASRGNPANLNDLTGHRFLGYIDELVFSSELDYFTAALPGVPISMKISNVITQMNATISGAGLCILPCFMADRQSTLVRVLHQEVRLIRSYWLLTHADSLNMRRVKATAQFIREAVHDAREYFLPGD